MGLGGGDANATDGVADTQGADGAVVTGVAGGSVGEPLAGAYGVLTLNGDGSYSYVLDNASQRVQGLAAGEVLTESRSEEHTSELQSLMRISYAVFCLKKKNNTKQKQN